MSAASCNTKCQIRFRSESITSRDLDTAPVFRWSQLQLVALSARLSHWDWPSEFFSIGYPGKNSFKSVVGCPKLWLSVAFIFTMQTEAGQQWSMAPPQWLIHSASGKLTTWHGWGGDKLQLRAVVGANTKILSRKVRLRGTALTYIGVWFRMIHTMYLSKSNLLPIWLRWQFFPKLLRHQMNYSEEAAVLVAVDSAAGQISTVEWSLQCESWPSIQNSVQSQHDPCWVSDSHSDHGSCGSHCCDGRGGGGQIHQVNNQSLQIKRSKSCDSGLGKPGLHIIVAKQPSSRWSAVVLAPAGTMTSLLYALGPSHQIHFGWYILLHTANMLKLHVSSNMLHLVRFIINLGSTSAQNKSLVSEDLLEVLETGGRCRPRNCCATRF